MPECIVMSRVKICCDLRDNGGNVVFACFYIVSHSTCFSRTIAIFGTTTLPKKENTGGAGGSNVWGEGEVKCLREGGGQKSYPSV